MENILVLCAHPDDEVFGLGGTIAKYAKEGKKVTTIIFSYGERALPLLKEEEVIKIRQNESLAAAKIIGTSRTLFLGLKEGKIEKANKANIEVLKSIVKQTNPTRIFTHSMDDPHVDHRQVHNLVRNILHSVNYKGEVYAFELWNPLTIRKRGAPRLYVDITETFKLKMEAIRKFETQKVQGRWPLTPAVVLRAVIFGIQNHCRYAERFFKVDVKK